MHISSITIKRKLAKALERFSFGKRAPLAKADPRSQSWARSVRSYEEVPSVYRSFLDALPGSDTSPFPYTVLTPIYIGIYGKAEHERLVCATGSHIHVLERIEDRFTPTSYRLDCISFVETGIILLHAWISIHGLSDTGLASSTTLVFNSVADQVMAPLVECMRSTVACTQGTDVHKGRASLNYLATVNYKFMRYGKRSIRPDDNLGEIIYQPEIHLDLLRWPLFHLSRSISPAHLVILTDRELILIRDDDSQSWLQGSPHGAIRTYVPRNKIKSAGLGIQNNLLLFTITLADNLHIQSLFEESKKAELERLLLHLNA